MMVPRDRIELSTPAFSRLKKNEHFQYVARLWDNKLRQIASHKISWYGAVLYGVPRRRAKHSKHVADLDDVQVEAEGFRTIDARV